MNALLRQHLPTLGLIFAAVLIAVLGAQNRRLSDEVMRYAERAARPYDGLWVPTFRTRTMAGDTVTIGRSTDGKQQVLFIFNSTCPFCEASIPAWEEVATELRSEQPVAATVYGISLDSLAEQVIAYAREHGLTYPIVQFPEAKLISLYRATVVPITVVLDAHGRVTYARAGRLSGRAAVDSILAVARRARNASGWSRINHRRGGIGEVNQPFPRRDDP